MLLFIISWSLIFLFLITLFSIFILCFFKIKKDKKNFLRASKVSFFHFLFNLIYFPLYFKLYGVFLFLFTGGLWPMLTSTIGLKLSNIIFLTVYIGPYLLLNFIFSFFIFKKYYTEIESKKVLKLYLFFYLILVIVAFFKSNPPM